MSPQFHCIYNANFSICKCGENFTSLWKHKEKLQSHLQTKAVIDVLPTQQDSQLSQLPGASDPLPRFMEPWILHPVTSSTDDSPANLLEEPPIESLEEPSNYQPDMQEINVDITTGVSQFEW